MTRITPHERDRAGAGHDLTGRAIVEQMDATTLVLPAMKAKVDAYRNLILEAA
jgi:N-methylhydantoinase A